MAYSKYMQDPLDDEYLIIPGDFMEEGTFPIEEMEVRHALVAMKISTDRSRQYGIVARLIRTDGFKRAIAATEQRQNELMDLVNSSLLHKAALRRIVNSMPPDNGGREFLVDYIR